jgi:hypothetical protein
VSDGRVSPQEYAANVKNINAMKQEGVHEALDLMAQGQYQEAMDKFNSVGVRRGVQFVSAKDGMTPIDGVQQPTKLVTLRAPDGTISTTDVTQARYQLMNIDQQLTHADKAANTAMLAGYHGKMGDYYAQQAKTQEQWRADQASNFRMQRQEEQEKIDALKNGQQAPLWDDKARARLDKLYTQTDPTTGAPAYDPTGAIFAKQVGLARSRTNGGDVEGALDFAYQTDLGLKQAAGNDPAKLAQLRAGYLNSIAPKGAPAPQAPASASGSATQGSAAATTLSGNDPNGPADTDHQGLKGTYTRDQIAQIAAANNEPGLLAQYDRQVASDRQAAAPTAPAKPLLAAVGGVTIADRDKKIALMNQYSGNDLSRRSNVISAATDNVAKNFDSQLATLKPGATRADLYKTLTWFDDNAPYMTPLQMKQVKQARQAMGM